MPLMDRIKITSFLDLHHGEQYLKIQKIQALRVQMLAEAKVKKTGMTKTQRKIREKKGTLPKSKVPNILKTIDKLSLAELENLLLRMEN